MPYFRINGVDWPVPATFDLSAQQEIRRDLQGNRYAANPKNPCWSGLAAGDPFYLLRVASAEDQAWITRQQAEQLFDWARQEATLTVDTDLPVKPLTARPMHIDSSTFSLSPVDPAGEYWRFDVILRDLA